MKNEDQHTQDLLEAREGMTQILMGLFKNHNYSIREFGNVLSVFTTAFLSIIREFEKMSGVKGLTDQALDQMKEANKRTNGND